MVNRLAKFGIASTSVIGLTLIYLDFIKPTNKPNLVDKYEPLVKSLPTPPSRSELVKQLTKSFDVLIIGGGSAGTGTALDATTRNLSVALLEKNDFASGTSSKSTKMAHGGVRYLEKAILGFSKSQLDLVIEALNERGNMLRTAPHLVTILPIMIPVYKYWQVPYFFAGCKMYDWFAGKQNLRNSMVFSREMTLSVAPMIDDANLKASCIYHDGSFNDSRMNSSLAITAINHGATLLNYFEVNQLLKDDSGKIIGVKATDLETGEIHSIKSKAVINCTGPHVDNILQMDETVDGKPPSTPQPLKMVVPSSGVHIVLPEYYGPKKFGLLDPATSDGRVMFFLPWQGKILAGTTDTPLSIAPVNPVPTESEINDILKELQKYLTFPVQRSDVLSAWSGIRPLVRDPSNKGSTENLVRSHLITVSDSNLVTLSGGKWTTYREMAEETVDTVVKKFNFTHAKPCQTNNLVLIGGENFTPSYPANLIHEYKIPLKLAAHLASNYGTRSPLILETYFESDYNKLPVGLAHIQDFSPIREEGRSITIGDFDEPFTVAELLYSIRYEYARTPIDFLARRSRLAFLNAKVAYKSIDGVISVMKRELNWSDEVAKKMRKDAEWYIGSMGEKPIESQLTKESQPDARGDHLVAPEIVNSV